MKDVVTNTDVVIMRLIKELAMVSLMKIVFHNREFLRLKPYLSCMISNLVLRRGIDFHQPPRV